MLRPLVSDESDLRAAERAFLEVFEAALALLPINLDWLDIVLAAGHRPTFEELVVALRLQHIWWERKVLESEAGGCDGDALGWTGVADLYRSLVGELEGFARAMERHQARLERTASEEHGAGPGGGLC